MMYLSGLAWTVLLSWSVATLAGLDTTECVTYAALAWITIGWLAIKLARRLYCRWKRNDAT